MTAVLTKTQTTGIEWTNHTWNPFVGCNVHTAGCKNCYAMKQAGLIASTHPGSHYNGVVQWIPGGSVRDSVWTGKLNKSPPHIMNKPTKIKTPSMIFVNSMSDFFHDKADPEWQREAMKVMARTDHFYQILTKRPENIGKCVSANGLFPPNVIVGATMERYDYRERIGILRELRQADMLLHTFLSIEPLVGPPGDMDLSFIDWVIVGGESGPDSREMKFEWLLSVLDQCKGQMVPIFFKQYGIPQNNPLYHKGGVQLIAKLDPVGKGGSKIHGKAYKEFPVCIEDWRQRHDLSVSHG